MASLRAGEFDLVLVNRVLDADGSSGLDLIRAIKADPDLANVPVMLVSNSPRPRPRPRPSGPSRVRQGRPPHGSVPALDTAFGQSA